MKIIVVFPLNNPVENINTKPVVLAGYPYVKNSMFSNNIKVISSYTNNTLFDINVIVIPKAKSNKQDYSLAVKENIRIELPDIVEVHQDATLAGDIAKAFPQVKVSLVKHNNYIKNSFKEKFSLYKWWVYKKYLSYIHNIYCVSYAVRDHIQSAYPALSERIFVHYNTYGHILPFLKLNNDFSTKENIILFVGKPVEHKGIKEFMLALPKVLAQNKDWRVIIISAFFSKKAKYNKLFYQLIKEAPIKNLINNGRIVLKDNLNIREVFNDMLAAKIVVVPTKIDEPFGLVALEASMAKCCVISSNKGGLKEININSELLLNKVDIKELEDKLISVIKGDNLEQLANKGYNYCYQKFNPKTCVKILDNQRLALAK